MKGPMYVYICKTCGKQVNKKPAHETKSLGSWRCPCSGRDTKVQRQKN